MKYINYTICILCLCFSAIATNAQTPTEVCEAIPADGRHSIWFQKDLGKDFITSNACDGSSNDGLTFTEYDDGTATLKGCVARKYSSNKRFVVDLLFSNRVDPGDVNFPPTGSPKNAPSGSPTGSWHYYLSITGTYRGERDLSNVNLSVSRRGPALQIGDGGGIHGSSSKLGLAVWFYTQPIDHSPVCPNGDINVWLECQPKDCNNTPGGSEELDLCGVCGGNNSCLDCKGVPNGTSVLDDCGVCDGNNIDKGCDGVCNSGKVVDECQVCGGPGKTGCDSSCGSTNVYDDCGVCGGDNSSCLDCFGVTNGTSVVDDCGVCGGDNSSCLPKDCAGIVGGTLVEDNNGICCEQSEIDECGQCGGSGRDSCGLCSTDPGFGSGGCLDCSGKPNGESKLDICGVCEGDNTTCECNIHISNPVEIDTLSNEQANLVSKYSRKYAKTVGGKKRKRALANSSLAKDLHIQSWTTLWLVFGESTTQCSTLTDCDRVDLTSDIVKIQETSDKLFKLAKRYINKLYKNKRRTRKRLIKEAKFLKDETHQESNKLPSFESVCE